MANKILHKRSSTASATPTAGQLDAGELAINLADGRLFAKKSDNSVVNLPVASISGQIIAPQQVGVNVASPAAPLHVSGASSDVNTPIQIIESTGSQIPCTFRASGVDQAYVKGDSGGNLAFGAQGFIAFEAGGFGSSYEIARFSTNANIALGVTHTTDGFFGAALGGQSNTVSNAYATVVGGLANNASADLSVIIGGSTCSASGGYSTVINSGGGTASAGYSLVLNGSNSTASGYRSAVICGETSSATARYSTALGPYSRATHYGAFTHSGGRFTNSGDAQYMRLVLRRTTSSASPLHMSLDGSTTYPIIAANTTWMFTVQVAAYTAGSASGAGWFFRGVLRRDGADNTAIVNSVISESWQDSGLANADVTVTANNTSEYLQIQVTGLAATSIRWVAVADIVQVSTGAV